jgi:hypothetical protein
VTLPDEATAAARLRREQPLFGDSAEEIRALLPIARREAPARAADFAAVSAYCMFIGYPRSGHSVVGSLLDAHEHVLIAHELNALKFVEAGCTRAELFWLLAENSRRFAQHGRQWGDYRYEVPGQWQGRYSTLQVIGDKKGGSSSMLLARQPGLLEALRRVVPERLCLIHVTRNPYDNIATMARKDTRDLGKAIRLYFELCAVNRRVAADAGAGSVLHLRSEELIADPAAALRRLAAFLGVGAPADWLAACAATVAPSPHRSRDAIPWPAPARARVEAGIAEFDFLHGYRFEA